MALLGGEGLEGLRDEPADRLPAAPPGLDEPGGPEPAEVPRHERLGQADVLDQLGDGGLPLRQAADDPEAVDIRQRLVEQPDRPEVVRLVDDGGDGGADSRGRRAQGRTPRVGRACIKNGLYEYALMRRACQAS